MENKSATIGELAKALCNVQSKLAGAKKDSTNPFFKSKYADLAACWDACRDLLSANGLSVVQTTSVEEGWELVLDTVLMHTSGEWIDGQLPVKLVKSDPQGLGSAITYARRYALCAIVGICPEDDDGESAVKRTPPKPAERPTPKPAEKPAEKPVEKTAEKSKSGKPTLTDKLTRLSKEVPKIWSTANVLKTLKGLGGTGETGSEMLKSLDDKVRLDFFENVNQAIATLDAVKLVESAGEKAEVVEEQAIF